MISRESNNPDNPKIANPARQINIGFPVLDVVLVLASKSTKNDHQGRLWKDLPVHPTLSPSDVLTRLTTPRLSGGVTGSFQSSHHITRREYILV